MVFKISDVCLLVVILLFLGVVILPSPFNTIFLVLEICFLIVGMIDIHNRMKQSYKEVEYIGYKLETLKKDIHRLDIKKLIEKETSIWKTAYSNPKQQELLDRFASKIKFEIINRI